MQRNQAMVHQKIKCRLALHLFIHRLQLLLMLLAFIRDNQRVWDQIETGFKNKTPPNSILFPLLMRGRKKSDCLPSAALVIDERPLRNVLPVLLFPLLPLLTVNATLVVSRVPVQSVVASLPSPFTHAQHWQQLHAKAVARRKSIVSTL